MDPPPLPPPPQATNHQNDSSSAASSPRSSSAAGDHHHHLPPKLRLMCSYGGHIIPRPRDKSLCYAGGETRMVVVDRHSSLEELHRRLSHSLLNGRHFTIKYQLPSEDLDSLISIATDEDLENMIDEYDRFASSPSLLKPSSRLRLFMFPSRPATAASMGALLDGAKSETWFVDVLNGVDANLLPRGLSDSATIDRTVLDQIDDDKHNREPTMQNSDSCSDLESQLVQHHHQIQNRDNKQLSSSPQNDDNVVHQVAVALDQSQHSPPPVETNSSFGSSSSTPSMSNLPPIEVRAEDYQTFGLEDPQISNQVNNTGILAPTGSRKPPLPLQSVQRKPLNIHNLPSSDSKNSYNLASPDSVASDSSIASAGSLSPNQQLTMNTAPEVKQLEISSATIQEQPSVAPQFSVQPSLMSLLPPHQTQQYIHQNNPRGTTHYVQHPPIPASSYYQPIYIAQQTQTDQHHHRPMYFIQTQSNYGETTEIRAPPNLYTVPSHQIQRQYIGGGIPQVPVQCQSNNYGYEYSNLIQDQMYYAATTQMPPPSQYQTMTPATAVMLSQASSAQVNPSSDKSMTQ